jgi:hypothetical protein
MIIEHSPDRLTYAAEPSHGDGVFVYFVMAGSVLAVAQAWDQVEHHVPMMVIATLFCAGLWSFQWLVHIKRLAVFDRASGTFGFVQLRGRKLLHRIDHALSEIEDVMTDMREHGGKVQYRPVLIVAGKRLLLNNISWTEQGLSDALRIREFLALPEAEPHAIISSAPPAAARDSDVTGIALHRSHSTLLAAMLRSPG